jgi:hypothetical protein
MQAIEALKILGESLSISTEVFCFDVDKFSYTRKITKDETCACCAGQSHSGPKTD